MYTLEDIDEALGPLYGVLAELPPEHPEIRRLASILAKRADIPETILASVQLDVQSRLLDDDMDDSGRWLARFNDALADELLLAA